MTMLFPTLRALDRAVLCLVVLWSTGVFGVAGTSRAIAAKVSEPEEMIAFPREDDPLVARGNEEAQRSRDTRLAERQTSQAVAQRRASQKAYRGLPADEARALGQRVFAGPLAALIGPQAGLQPGQEVERYLDDRTAVVDGGSERDRVLVSMLPLRTERAGEKVPVDLDLRSSDAGFEPVAPLVDVTLPADSGDAVALPGGVRLRFADAASRRAVESAGRLWYHDIKPDVDGIALPTMLGAELLWQLRSAAPGEVEVALEADLPSGYGLRQRPADGTFGGPAVPAGAVEVIDGDGAIAAVIAPAWATAGDGEPVATRMRIDGERRVVITATVSEDTAMPVLVDPVVDSWGPGNLAVSCQSSSAAGAWQYAQSASMYPMCDHSTLGQGLYVVGYYQTYYDGQIGQWTWSAPAYSRIHYAWFDGLYHWSWATSLYTGVWSGSRQAYEAYGAWTENQTGWGAMVHQYYPVSDHSVAVFGFRMNGTGPRYGTMVGMRGAQMQLSEPYAPWASVSSHVNPSIGPDPTGLPFYTTGWYDPNTLIPQVRWTAYDTGLGLWQTAVMDYESGRVLAGPTTSGCQGNYGWMCSTNVPMPATNYDLRNEPDGLRRIGIWNRDIVGNVGWSGLWGLRLDRVGPRIDFGNELWAAQGQTLTKPWYALTINVNDSDNDPTTPQGDNASGVKTVTVQVDSGPTYTLKSSDCGITGNCNFLDPPFNLDTTNVNVDGGTHTITVRASDQLNHQSSRSFQVTYWPSSIRHGGSNGRLDQVSEIEAFVTQLESVDEATATRMWSAVHPDDRLEVLEQAGYAVANSPSPDYVLDTEFGDITRDLLEQMDDDDIDPELRATAAQQGTPVRCALDEECVRRVCRLLGGCDEMDRPHTPQEWTDNVFYRAGSTHRYSRASAALRAAIAPVPIDRNQETFGWAAHHIIAAFNRQAVWARIIAIKCGILPNDVINGIFLRNRSRVAGSPGWNALYPSQQQRTYHPTLHTPSYYKTINRRLLRAVQGSGCDEGRAIRIMNNINDELRLGTFVATP